MAAYDITASATVSDEVFYQGSVYKISPGEHTITIMATNSSYPVTEWTLEYRGVVIDSGTSNVSKTITYTFGKARQGVFNFTAKNSQTTKTIFKAYNVGGTPDIDTQSIDYYDYNYGQTVDTSTERSTQFMGNYYSLSYTSWGASGGYYGITYLSLTNSYVDDTTGRVGYTFRYKLGSTIGLQYLVIVFKDSEYGDTTGYKYIYVCMHPRVSCTASSLTPDVGTQVTITNTSSETSGVNCRYNWYTNDENGLHPISGMQGVAKSKTYQFTPTSTKEQKIVIEGYDNNHSGYASKPTTTITISPVSKVPTPTVTYSPSTFYYADNVNLTITESFTPTVPITYHWYVNGTEVSGVTGKEYTLENIRSNTNVYVVGQWGSTTNQSETITLRPSYVPITASAIFEPDEVYADFTEMSDTITIISKHQNLRITSYKVIVRENNASGKIVHELEYITDELAHTFNIPQLTPNGAYYHMVYAFYTYTGTSGEEYSNSFLSTRTVQYMKPVPIADFEIITESPVPEGKEVVCRNTTDEMEFSGITYEWRINNELYSTSKELSFVAEKGVSVYTIGLTAVNNQYRSTELTKTISVIESYDPMKRWTIVISDLSKNHSMYSREAMCPNNFVMLKYEHRLNEVGLGSVTLFCKPEDESSLKTNNRIFIFDNNYCVYIGTVTSVEKRNNLGIGFAGVGPEVNSQCIYDIDFAEDTRSLSQEIPINTGLFQGTPQTICNNLSPRISIMNSGYPNKLQFNIDDSNVLSQVDSFCDQFNMRYRLYIRRIMFENAALIYDNGDYYYNPSGALGNPDEYIFYKDDKRMLFAVAKRQLQYSYILYKLTDYIVLGESLPKYSFLISKFCRTILPLIEMAETYYNYPSSSVFNGPLLINRDCYDINNSYKVEKEYGTLNVISPATTNKSQSCSVKLGKVVGKDGSSQMYNAVLSETNDGVVVLAELNSTETRINLYVKGSPKKESYIIFCMKQSATSYKYYMYHILDEATYSNITINIDGVSMDVVKITDAMEMNGLNISKSEVSALPGSLIVGNEYKFNGVLTNDGGDLYIGSEKITSYSINSKTITVNRVPNWVDVPMAHFSGVPVYYQKSSGDDGSPYKLYKDRAMTVTVQSGLNYPQIELLAFHLIRYNSNFTSTVTGSCALKHWTDNEYRFPYVGSKINIKAYDDDVMDLECQSYTINADEMRCDFNLGMKPITIGDVVYRIKSNQMTNIN